VSEVAVADTPRRPGRPSDADSAATRARILEAALHAFADEGYDATTNKKIAKAAGVTATALYHYFPSKSEIYRATSEAVYDRLATIFRSGNLDGAPLAERMERIMAMLDAARASDRSVVGFIVGLNDEARRRPEIAAALRPAQTGLVAEVAALVRAAPDCEAVLGPDRAEVFADLLIGSLAGLARLSHRARDPRRLVDPMTLLVDLVRRAR
jgi:AcrR family transcriptional regulator